MNFPKNKTNAQRGFTLIELIIVVIVIGILISVFLPSVKDAVNPSKSVALLRAADQITQTVSLVAKQCGVSTTVTGNVLADTGKTLSDVVFGGEPNVAAAYKSCYKASQAKALAEVGSPTATAGEYEVQGLKMTLAGGGTAPIQVSYAAAPDEIVLGMAQKYNSTLTTLAASDAASTVVQYGTVTAGQRTVTVVKQ